MDQNTQDPQSSTRIDSDFPLAILGVRRLPDFVRFVQWYATPPQFREPATQKEFAAAIRVDEDTLTSWKKHPNFLPLVYESMRRWMQEHLPDVIGSLFIKLNTKKVNAHDIDLFWRLAGMQTPDLKSATKSKTKN